jgi:uncharacterized protein YdeI (YjbR/CyaY-like superfamily)
MVATKRPKAAAVVVPAAPAVPVPPIPQMAFADRAAWSAWLGEHHAVSRGLWLKLAKKAAEQPSVTYPEAIEVALAWGWIDGPKASLNDAWWLQKFTPRSQRSLWSKINREKAIALIESGAMMPPGLSEVDRAKRDGRWQAAYEPASRATVPDDLAAALSKNPRAAAFFAALDGANRYAILFRIHNVKKAETRAKKIETYVQMLAEGKKLHN